MPEQRTALPVPATIRLPRSLDDPGADWWCRVPLGAGLPVRPMARPLFFCWHMARLCRDVIRRTPELAHVDMDRVLVTLVACRNDRRQGVVAKLVPLAFAGGAAECVLDGWVHRIQKVFVGRVRQRYVLACYLPRMLRQGFRQRLVTVFHELYHVGAACDGDLRRFPGTDSIHDRSPADYDRRMDTLCGRYLAENPDATWTRFLQPSLPRLAEQHGEAVGPRFPCPKRYPVRPADPSR